jgi:hypothetical protein
MPNGRKIERMKFHLTRKSTNKKTGKIPVSTSPRNTCPDNCPLKQGGCYAGGGPLLIHWRKISSGQRGVSWVEFLDQIRKLPDGQLWRHNQAGDLRSRSNHPELINQDRLKQLWVANRGKRGFTYTHHRVIGKDPVARSNRDIIAKANSGGFTINLSADSLRQADELANLEIGPVTTTLSSLTTGKSLRTPGGRKVVVCPAARNDEKLHSCEVCGFCQKADRKFVIGFPAHGFQTKIVDQLVEKLDA